jgi:DNA repair photolyase
MKKIYKRFRLPPRPNIVSEKYGYTFGKNKIIFVGSAFDCWAKNVPDEWIRSILSFVKGNMHNVSFLFQSKNPERFIDWLGYIPYNAYLCTTLESNREYPAIYQNAPPIIERVKAMHGIKNRPKMITIEPILDFGEEFIQLLKMCQPTQINIGANTGCNHLPEPPSEKIAALVGELRGFTRVHLKKNLARLYREAG